MPIGVYTGVFALMAVLTIASGVYLLIHAREVARAVGRMDGDIVAGPARGDGRRSRLPIRVVLAVFLVAMTGVGAFVVLYVTRVIGPETVRSQPAGVQRP
ncbi:hypothetical protein ACFSC3_08170 [Sphingomonas floccifaciens]|uniref:Uncharacterized protein n=1 Tax=Sphingomonas floccifaciens TaxID=1844115 RepID=A0ABW4NBN6_9SPHN